VIRQARDLGVRVSLFMDPVPEAMAAAAALGAHRIELYTEPYAQAFGTPDQAPMLARYAASRNGSACGGPRVNAGQRPQRAEPRHVPARCSRR